MGCGAPCVRKSALGAEDDIATLQSELRTSERARKSIAATVISQRRLEQASEERSRLREEALCYELSQAEHAQQVLLSELRASISTLGEERRGREEAQQEASRMGSHSQAWAMSNSEELSQAEAARARLIAEASQLRDEANVYRSELDEAAQTAQKQAGKLGRKLDEVIGERSAACKSLAEARMELGAEQAAYAASKADAEWLEKHLSEAKQGGQGYAEELRDAHAEMRRMQEERNAATRARDLALDRCEEAMDERDAALRARALASLGGGEMAEARRRASLLALGLEDAKTQLRIERDRSHTLEETVGLCAESGATQAAAFYMQAVRSQHGARTNGGGFDLLLAGPPLRQLAPPASLRHCWR